jgi:hypothetical protein
MLRLNAEREGTALAQHFEVGGLPNIVLLQPSGQKIEQIPGYLPASDFARMMESVLARVGPARVGPARAVVTRPAPATQPAPATRRPRTYTYGATSAEGRRRQAQALEQASGVMLLDNNGSRWIELPTKKAPAKKKTRTAKNLQRRSRNSR